VSKPKRIRKQIDRKAWLAMDPEERPIEPDEPSQADLDWDKECERRYRAWLDWLHWKCERENESPEDRAHDRLSLERDVFPKPNVKKETEDDQ